MGGDGLRMGTGAKFVSEYLYALSSRMGETYQGSQQGSRNQEVEGQRGQMVQGQELDELLTHHQCALQAVRSEVQGTWDQGAEGGSSEGSMGSMTSEKGWS